MLRNEPASELEQAFLRWEHLCLRWLLSRRTGYRRRARVAERAAWVKYHKLRNAALQRVQIGLVVASGFKRLKG